MKSKMAIQLALLAAFSILIPGCCMISKRSVLGSTNDAVLDSKGFPVIYIPKVGPDGKPFNSRYVGPRAEK